MVYLRFVGLSLALLALGSSQTDTKKLIVLGGNVSHFVSRDIQVRVKKTVFISYRRTNAPWALALYQALTHNGFDVFIDYKGLASGNFEQAILENIRSRAHFLIVLYTLRLGALS